MISATTGERQGIKTPSVRIGVRKAKKKRNKNSFVVSTNNMLECSEIKSDHVRRT